MRKLYYAAVTYMALGLAGGLAYRELTKLNGFTGRTELAVVHTHLLVLGMLVFLLLILLERAFTLSASRMFTWFFWIYNAGLAITVGAMAAIGTGTVLGRPAGAALTGIAGLGHILLTVALVLFFACLHSRLFGRAAADARPGAPEPVTARSQA